MNPLRTRLALLSRTTQRRYVTVLDPQNTGCSPMKPTTSVGPIETAIRTRVSEAFSRRDRKGKESDLSNSVMMGTGGRERTRCSRFSG